MSHTVNNITLVCYDITSNKLRRKIDKCMQDFGIRLQYSIFICRLDMDGLTRCRRSLTKVLQMYAKEQENSDSLIIFEQLNANVVDNLLGKRADKSEPAFRII